MRFAATVKGITELILDGWADLGFWKNALRGEGLHPMNHHGKAKVMLGAFKGRWMGVRFTEFIVAVEAYGRCEGKRHEGYFLVQGYNSRRLFAATERLHFKTPYRHARIQLDESVVIEEEGQAVYHLVPNGTQPTDECKTDWFGSICFRASNESPGRHYFLAKLVSDQQVFGVDEENDRVDINRHPEHPAAGLLMDSGFEPFQWRRSNDVLHARTKTFTGPLPNGGRHE